jgi:ligand-binding sensor domain-containing protein/AraC-like DNA-binding protein
MRSKLKSNAAGTKQFLAAIIVFFLLWCPSLALNPGKNIDEYLLDHWNISGGLPSNLIHSIAQTPDGYLWIATNKGLVRFDGLKFSIVRFAREEEIANGQTAVPEALYTDKGGKLWIGSSMGLTSYNYKTRQFNTFTTTHGLARGTIRRLTEDMKGNLWMGFVSAYINRYSGGKFTAFNDSHGLTGKKINGLIEDRQGNLLVGARDNGVFKYRDGKFFNYPIPGLKGFLVTMCEDHNGSLWISTSKGLLKKTGNIVETYTTKNGLSIDHTSDILEDRQGTLWIGTTNGLNRLKTKADGSVSFECTLNSIIIICLYEDREGSLWVGTLDSGLFRLKDAKFKSYTLIEKDREDILFSMYEDRNGDTWIGTIKGKLSRYRNRQQIDTIQIPGISGTGISAISEDAEGSLWLGTNGNGVIQMKAGTIVQYTTREGLADNLVTGITIDSRGNPWFSTFDGVSVFYPRDNTMAFLDSRGGLSGKKVHNVYEDKTRDVWIAADNGITVLKGGKMERQHMKYYLEGISVTWIYEDPTPMDGEGRIFWLTTHGAGMKRLRLKDGAVTTYTKSRGMFTNFLYRFFEDQGGNFWIMSDSGILRVSKVDLNHFAREESGWINCTSFGKSEGLLSLEFNNPFSRHTALKTKSGELRFLAKKGISMVNPDRIRINKLPPPVVIEKVFFNQESIPLPLPANDNTFSSVTDIRFHFTATTLLSAEKVTFKYRLEGFDKKWTYLAPGKERVARYKNLEPGTYTFRVTASNAEGAWNPGGTAVTFTLKSSFLKSPFFNYLILALTLAALLAIGFIIYRTYKKQPPGKTITKKEDKEIKISLPPGFVKENIKKLTHLMEEEKVYREEKLTLISLAEKLSMRRHQLSLILNDHLKSNFNDYINSYRIEEAKRILESPEAENKTNDVIAIEVGFNSTTSFYQVFKKYTGMTPTRYKKKAHARRMNQ